VAVRATHEVGIPLDRSVGLTASTASVRQRLTLSSRLWPGLILWPELLASLRFSASDLSVTPPDCGTGYISLHYFVATPILIQLCRCYQDCEKLLIDWLFRSVTQASKINTTTTRSYMGDEQQWLVLADYLIKHLVSHPCASWTHNVITRTNTVVSA
jgi:hypothetical protein